MERNDQSGPQQPEETDINQKTMCERGKQQAHNNITRSKKRPQYELEISFLDAIARIRFLAVLSRCSTDFFVYFRAWFTHTKITWESQERRKCTTLLLSVHTTCSLLILQQQISTSMKRKKNSNNSSSTKKVEGDESGKILILNSDGKSEQCPKDGTGEKKESTEKKRKIITH